MLRTFLLLVAAVLLVGGLLARALGHPGALVPALWGGGLLAALLFERWRYRAGSRPAGAGWVRTDERFVDPETGRTLQVWYDPRTGARRYEDAGEGPV